MKCLKLVSLVLFLVGNFSLAGVLKKELGANEIESIKLAKSASVSYQDKNYNLKTVGAGLRAKKVLMINVNVYVAEFFVSEEAQIEKKQDKILDSLAKANAAVMQLTFLRDVDGEKVESSFKDALVANKADLNDQAIKTILEKVAKSGGVKKGQTLTFASFKNTDSSEVVIFEPAMGEATQVKGNNIIKPIFSMWLGESADSGVKKLKESLLK